MSAGTSVLMRTYLPATPAFSMEGQSAMEGQSPSISSAAIRRCLSMSPPPSITSARPANRNNRVMRISPVMGRIPLLAGWFVWLATGFSELTPRTPSLGV